LRDLRRLAIARLLPQSEEWDGRMYGRLAALPDQAEPLQRSRLLAALSVGTAIIQLRHMAPHLGAAAELDAAFAALARGKSAIAIPQLRQLDYRLAGSDTGPETAIALGARSRLLVISEALAVHHDRTAPGRKPLRLSCIRLCSFLPPTSSFFRPGYCLLRGVHHDRH
jgi:hypothetical protein